MLQFVTSAFPISPHYVSLLYLSPLPLSIAPVQFSTSVSPTAPMEAPLPAQYGAPLEPLSFGLGHPTEPIGNLDPESCPSPNTEHLPQSEHTDYLPYGSQFSPNGTSTTDSAGSSTTINSSTFAAEEEECMVDSQPICFKENPFLVANRKGKGRPRGEQILSGPPVGYGKPGQLQPWLFSKASHLPECGLEAAWCVTEHSLLFGSLVSHEMDQTFVFVEVLTFNNPI